MGKEKATPQTLIVKAKVKVLTITSVVTIPKNASKAWTAQVIAAGKQRSAAVAAVVAAKVKALRTSVKVVQVVRTTSVAEVRVVRISGTK